MKRLRSFVASMTLAALLPWQAAIAAPSAPSIPQCNFNGDVYAMKTYGDGSTYVGGAFTTVTCDGGAHTYNVNHVARIDSAGNADPAWDGVGTNGPVYAIEIANTDVIIGGDFTSVHGGGGDFGYDNLARLNLFTGLVDTAFSTPDIGAGTNGPINAIVFNNSSNELYVGGSFTTVTDQWGAFAQVGLGAFSAANGEVLQNWSGIAVTGGSQTVNTLATHGMRLFVGGSFDTVSWLAGTKPRNHAFAIDLAKDPQVASDLVTDWDPDTDGPIYAMGYDVGNNRMFLGGNFTQSKVTSAPVSTPNLQLYEMANGDPDGAFNLWADGTVYSLYYDGSYVYIGGDFSTIGSTSRAGGAEFDVANPVYTLGAWDPQFDNIVRTVSALDHDLVFAGGSFSLLNGGTAAQAFARFASPTPSHDISGTVFEDVNFGLNAGRNKVNAYAGGGLPVANARVEFYNANTQAYLGYTTTNASGDYVWTAPGDGDYIVRVVDETVVSNRTQNFPATGLMPVTTFVTDAGNPITDRVGGADPSLADAAANSGAQLFTDLTTGPDTPQTYGRVTISGSSANGIDFGYNFDTVVNTNDSGRGSLRSAIQNANALSNTGLAQNGFPSGVENIVFKIPNGNAGMGLNSSLNYFNGTQNAAVITLTSDLPVISETLGFDAIEQPSLAANTSTPIVLDSNGYSHGLQFTGAGNHVRGLSFMNASVATLTFDNGQNEILGNAFGVLPDGSTSVFTDKHIIFNNDIAGADNTVGSNGEGNSFAVVGNTAIFFSGSASNSVIQANYFGLHPDGITTGYCYDGVAFSTAATDVLIGGSAVGDGNVFANCQGDAIRQWSPTDELTHLVIQGNSFGTDATGLVAINSSYAMYLNRTVDLLLGGNNPGEGNLFVSMTNPAYIAYATGTRVYGNTFGLFSDQVTAAPNSSYRSVLFDFASTDTEIGDGSVDGVNVFAGGIGAVGFTDYGVTAHHDVRIKGNKVGVDRTGMIALPPPSGFQFYRIDGLTFGGVNPGEGNQIVSQSDTALRVYNATGLTVYGNICNANADVSAGFNTLNSTCLDLTHTDNAMIGGPGTGRNYFSGTSYNVSLNQSEQVTIQNNYFNLNASGSAPLVESSVRGLSISDSTNTLIGGINPGEGNYFGPHRGSLIVGDLGMAIDIQRNNGVWIQGNMIGTDASGTIPYESDFGIGVGGIFGNDSQNIVIGGNTSAHGNVIFGGFGVLLYGVGASHVLVENNSIGVNRLGVATSSGWELTPLPFDVLKPAQIGIVWGANNNVIQHNVIGGTPSYYGGKGPGIYIAQEESSPFGVVPPPSQNLISQNSFSENAGASIDIETSHNGQGGDGVTPNDGITDVALAQNGLDYPIITSSTLAGGTLYVEGFVGTTSGQAGFGNIAVEIYRLQDDGNQNGEVISGDGNSVPHGEGVEYLGTIMTGANGNFSGNVLAPFLSSSTGITALAIDGINNTSEFGTYFDGIITTPPTSTPPTSTPPVPTNSLPIAGLGGLACHNTQGNHCDNNVFLNMQTTPVIDALVPKVPLVPMPWLNETTTTPPVVCKPLITKYLKKGNANDASQVKLLQQFLKERDRSYQGPINGQFDLATDTAVRAFQKKYAKDILGPWGHNTPTGYVYITTSRKINALNCQR